MLGVTGYVVYPAAPPWLASEQGEIGAVDRISELGLGVPPPGLGREAHRLRPAESNPVAAMPSLHAGAALLVALFLWPLVGRLWRVVLVAYALAMALTLVYTGEHYVVDVFSGWLVAVAAIAAGAVLRRRRGVGLESREAQGLASRALLLVRVGSRATTDARVMSDVRDSSTPQDGKHPAPTSSSGGHRDGAGRAGAAAGQGPGPDDRLRPGPVRPGLVDADRNGCDTRNDILRRDLTDA